MTAALVLIDIQNDYFPDGRYPLVGIEAAAENAARLLAAAIQEFGTHGYELASINRILDAAGLSKSSFYYYIRKPYFTVEQY